MTKLRLISHIFCSFATLTSHNKANYHRIYHHCRDLLPTHRAGSMAYSHVRAWIKVNKFRCCGWTDALHIMRWPAGIFFSSTINWASRQSSFVSRHTGHCFPFHKIERQTKKKKEKTRAPMYASLMSISLPGAFLDNQKWQVKFTGIIWRVAFFFVFPLLVFQLSWKTLNTFDVYCDVVWWMLCKARWVRVTCVCTVPTPSLSNNRFIYCSS